MRAALFIPCYVDALYPRVGAASLVVLERLGLEVEVPLGAVCCGQPLLNLGDARGAARAASAWIDAFSGFDRVVVPSGSCAAMIREHAAALAGAESPVCARTLELCEFLHDEVGLERIVPPPFARRVGLHRGCHMLRELRAGPASERSEAPPDKLRAVLERVPDIELLEPERMDECCGFGGTFSVFEEAVSRRMGEDRIDDLSRRGAEVVTSADMSCLMHLDGVARRDGREVRFAHVAEILAGTAP